MSKKKFEFSVLGFILGCFFFFLSFVLLHGYWLGKPFESFLSILVSIYLGACTWSLSYILKELDRFDSEVERIGYTIFKGGIVVLYFVAPIVYIWLKFFDTKNEGYGEDNNKNNHSEKLEFSHTDFITGSFLFFFISIFLHTAWLGNFFKSFLSIFVTTYLGICTWAFSYTLKECDNIINAVLEKPLGRVILLFVYIVLYFVSPVIYIWLKFFKEK